MKKIILLSLVTLFMFSCTSPEEKAEKLIKESTGGIIEIVQPPRLYKVINKEINDIVGYEMYYTQTVGNAKYNRTAVFNKDITVITDDKKRITDEDREMMRKKEEEAEAYVDSIMKSLEH